MCLLDEPKAISLRVYGVFIPRFSNLVPGQREREAVEVRFTRQLLQLFLSGYGGNIS